MKLWPVGATAAATAPAAAAATAPAPPASAATAPAAEASAANRVVPMCHCSKELHHAKVSRRKLGTQADFGKKSSNLGVHLVIELT